MSRGGRGAWRGRGGKPRIGGQEVSWEHDPDLVIDAKPKEIFPEIDIPRTRPPTRIEKTSVLRYRSIRSKIHSGPFYTVQNASDPKHHSSHTTASARYNPFESMPTYTKKYKPMLQRIPRFNTRKYNLKFFPKELWDVIDPSISSSSDLRSVPKPKKPRTLENIDDLDEDVQRNADDDNDDARPADDDEDEMFEENPDENFSEDDSDMGGDYNAEKYFDGGEDDVDDMGRDEDGGGDYD